MQPRIDHLLLRLPCAADQAAELPALVGRWTLAASQPVTLERLAYSAEHHWAYAYLALAQPQPMTGDDLAGRNTCPA